MIGPRLGWSEDDTPASQRYVILEIPVAGIYAVTMQSSGKTSVEIIDCGDGPVLLCEYGTRVSMEIELLPGRKRLKITTDIADEAVGEAVLRGPLMPGP